MSEDAPSPPPEPPSPAPPPPAAKPPSAAAPYRPNYVFLAVVTIVSLGLDLGTKWWAKARLLDPKAYQDRMVEVIPNHLSFTFAKNRGGAWGFLQDEPESVRRWFFLAVSLMAVGFIVSLYRKLHPSQTALKWGLPLVLGGALGNLVNRIQYQYVIDFIDFRADWVRFINKTLLRSTWGSDHWPTFNIADIAIVAGVVLMAIDMFTSGRETKKTVVKADAAKREAAPNDAPPPQEKEEAPGAKAPEASAAGESEEASKVARAEGAPESAPDDAPPGEEADKQDVGDVPKSVVV